MQNKWTLKALLNGAFEQFINHLKSVFDKVCLKIFFYQIFVMRNHDFNLNLHFFLNTNPLFCL